MSGHHKWSEIRQRRLSFSDHPADPADYLPPEGQSGESYDTMTVRALWARMGEGYIPLQAWHILRTAERNPLVPVAFDSVDGGQLAIYWDPETQAFWPRHYWTDYETEVSSPEVDEIDPRVRQAFNEAIEEVPYDTEAGLARLQKWMGEEHEDT